LSRVQRQEDRDRDEHRSQTGADGHRQPAPLAQFADVEFSARLETDREEEQRHEAAAEPVAEAVGQ
jgi:hypothetical protein